MAAATIAAIAALGTAGAGIYSAMSKSGAPAQQAQGIGRDMLGNALSNQDYMKLLNMIGLTRSTAGTQDSEGSETYYDPATNTWKTKLGDKPAQVQAASENASISRNTTDLRAAQAMNQLAMQRAAAAAPGADAARRGIENWRPSTADDLTALLTRNIVDSTNQTQRPITQEVLGNAARTGTSAAPQLEALGRANADNIRKSIMEATIAGRQNVGAMNASSLAPRVQKYGALYGATQPQLQYSQLDSQDPNKTLTALTADRAKTAGSVPFAGMQGLGYAQYGVNQAGNAAIGSVAPDTSGTTALSIGGQIGNLFKDPNVQKKMDSWFGGGSSDEGFIQPQANDKKGEG